MRTCAHVDFHPWLCMVYNRMHLSICEYCSEIACIVFRSIWPSLLYIEFFHRSQRDWYTLRIHSSFSQISTCYIPWTLRNTSRFLGGFNGTLKISLKLVLLRGSQEDTPFTTHHHIPHPPDMLVNRRQHPKVSCQ